MKNIKKFNDYFVVNENKNESLKMNVTDGELTVMVDDKVAKIKLTPNSSIRTATVMQDKKTIDVDVYQIPYGELKSALAENGIEVIVLDENNKSVKSTPSTLGNIYLVISLPKGTNGDVKYLSKAIGRGGNATKIVGVKDTTWGFYNLPDEGGLDDSVEVKPYTNYVFRKKVDPIVVNFSVDTPFDFDSARLSMDAQNKIKEELSKVKNKNVKIVIDTGASLDGDPAEKSGKEIQGKEVTRQEWDYFLTRKRYQAVGKFIKSLGYNSIIVRRSPKSAEDTKNIYGKFNSNKKSPENRQVLVKTKYLKK
jgi:hypothetical protein